MESDERQAAGQQQRPRAVVDAKDAEEHEQRRHVDGEVGEPERLEAQHTAELEVCGESEVA